MTDDPVSEPTDDEPAGTEAHDLAAAHAATLAELDELRTSHGMQALHERWDPTSRPLGHRRTDSSDPPVDAAPTDEP